MKNNKVHINQHSRQHFFGFTGEALLQFKSVVVVWILCSVLSVQAQTLADYQQLAAENNPGLKGKYAAFEAALAGVAQYNKLEDPSLSFGYFISPVETRVGPQRAQFSLSQMLPWFGTLKAKEDMLTLKAEAKFQLFLDARNQLFFEVRSVYYLIYEQTHHKWHQEENKAILETYKKLSLSKMENGSGSMTDVIRVNGLIDLVETKLALIALETKGLRVRFNNLLNRDQLAEVSVSEGLSMMEVAIDYRKDSLLVKNPLLAAYDLEIQSEHALQSLVKKQGSPQFGIGIDYAIVDQRTDISVPNNGQDVFIPRVSMTLPIFRGKYKAAAKEAELKATSLEAYKKDKENTLWSDYYTTWSKLEAAKNWITYYNNEMGRNQQITELLLAAYRNSEGSFQEVLDAQQEMVTYRMKKTEAIKDFHIAIAKLDYITSK